MDPDFREIERGREDRLAEEAGEASSEARPVILCPDCRRGAIWPRGRCDNCGLSWDDVEAAAEFADRPRG